MDSQDNLAELEERRDHALRTGAPDDVIGSLDARIEAAKQEGGGPRTIDGEVLPIVVDLGGRKQPVEADALVRGMLEHFGIEAEDLTGFVVACEYKNAEGVTLSSAWSLGVPAWRLRAFAAELSKHLDQV